MGPIPVLCKDPITLTKCSSFSLDSTRSWVQWRGQHPSVSISLCTFICHRPWVFCKATSYLSHFPPLLSLLLGLPSVPSSVRCQCLTMTSSLSNPLSYWTPPHLPCDLDLENRSGIMCYWVLVKSCPGAYLHFYKYFWREKSDVI